MVICICEFFNRKFTTKPLRSKKKDSTQKKILICLLFLSALSVQIRNELKSFLHKHTDDKASLNISTLPHFTSLHLPHFTSLYIS